MHAPSVENPLLAHVLHLMDEAGGQLPFDAFMAASLYTPGLGYYARGDSQFGSSPLAGDFITAPLLSAHFGQAIAQELAAINGAAHALGAQPCITEFGAGTGALMLQIAEQENSETRRHPVENAQNSRIHKQIIELSGPLRERQQRTLGEHPVQWLDELPAAFSGALIGNEVLDAIPCKLLHRAAGVWHERHVSHQHGEFAWVDLPTELRPPVEVPGEHDYTTEIHPQAEAFVRTVGARMQSAAWVLIDYGFGEREYYHPQRHMGTLMCHQGQRSDGNPLVDVGSKDITTHVNFTGIALAAQDAGLDVLGYTTQGRYLLNAGLLQSLEGSSLAERANAQKLVTEHEMGELFKVLVLCTPDMTEALAASPGLAVGDRTHTL